MISEVNINSLKYNKNLSFKANNDSFEPPVVEYGADSFIKDIDKNVDSMKKGNFFSKYLWSTTALIPAALLVLPYECHALHKANKLKKAGNIEALNNNLKNFKKVFPWLVVAAVGIYTGLQYLFNQNFDKKYKKLQQDFNKINTSTSAKLVDYTVRTQVMGALCSPISGNIVINRNALADPIAGRRINKLIKHELVHAKQYETIARSENGIKKLNFAVMKSISKSMDNPQGRAEIALIYDDIINDKDGKYDNKIISLIGADVNMKNYITAIKTIFENKDCGIDDIPMVIDVQHYKDVVKSKGNLTKEEEKKAELYYQAQIDYPKATIFQLLNPFSEYYGNLLECEAYKENPNFMVFIRKVCGK